MQCGVWEATNLLHIHTEELQELYLNFCLVHPHCIYPHNKSFMLSVVVTFYWARTGRQTGLWSYWKDTQFSLSCPQLLQLPLGLTWLELCSLLSWWQHFPVHGAAGAQRQNVFQYCALYLIAKTRDSFRWQNEVPTKI